MTGGLLHFIPASYDDLYLVINPEISFFKAVYKRHSNFSIESNEEVFENPVKFDTYTQCKLSKRGDLIANVSVLLSLGSLNDYGFDLTVASEKHYENNSGNCSCKKCLMMKFQEIKVFGWINSIGHALIDFYDLEIGGKYIEKQFGEWLEIWAELTQTSEKKLAYNEMIGKVDPPSFTADKFSDSLDLIIPLNLWFCRNIGLSLPCMSLYNEEIKIGLKIKSFDSCWVTNTPNVRPTLKNDHNNLINGSLLVDYIYLSIDERHKFYTEKHSYLIEQVNRDEYTFPANLDSINVDLTLNYCTKELIWVIQNNNVIRNPLHYDKVSINGYPMGNDWFNFTDSVSRKVNKIKDSFYRATIMINGKERFDKRKANYFRLYQPYNYHTGKPAFNNIYVYSFAFRPEEHQPTGQFPFRIFDNTQLHVQFNNKSKKKIILPRASKLEECNVSDVISLAQTKTIKIYSVNYNMFNVNAGQSSIVFF